MHYLLAVDRLVTCLARQLKSPTVREDTLAFWSVLPRVTPTESFVACVNMHDPIQRCRVA